MDYNIQELFKNLSLSGKRNELNKLLIKIDKLTDEMLKKNNIQGTPGVKNYNQNETENITEDEMLLSLYSDMMLIKNKILTVLVLET